MATPVIVLNDVPVATPRTGVIKVGVFSPTNAPVPVDPVKALPTWLITAMINPYEVVRVVLTVEVIIQDEFATSHSK